MHLSLPGARVFFWKDSDIYEQYEWIDLCWKQPTWWVEFFFYFWHKFYVLSFGRLFKDSGRVNLSCRHLCIYNLKAGILPWRDGKLHFHAPIGTLVSHDSNVLQYQKPVAAFAIIILRFIIDTLANVHVYMLQILTFFATFYHYVWSCVSFVYIWLDWMIQSKKSKKQIVITQDYLI